MSKERLEEMNDKVTGLIDSDGDFADEVKMNIDTYAWFYEQAERVQELERRNKMLQGNFKTIKQQSDLQEKINRDLVKENKRHRDENTELAVANDNLYHEIRILNNKITKLKSGLYES